MPKQILNAVPEVLYETAIPVYTYHFVVVKPEPPRRRRPVRPAPTVPPRKDATK